MTATVYYAGTAEIATLSNVFTVTPSGGGTPVPTDPTTVQLLVTDPAGVQTIYTTSSSPALNHTGPGAYSISIGTPTAGLWSYVWIGTGTASDVAPGTWRAHPPDWWLSYAGPEELKDRIGLATDQLTDSRQDSQVVMALRSAALTVNNWCGRYFYQLPGTRTYAPEDLWTLRTDDIVSVSQLSTDNDGDGVYETIWTLNTDYVLETPRGYNIASTGEPWPYTRVRVISPPSGSKYFPPVWPFRHLDSVKITGVFGWPAVPLLISEAVLQLGTDLYKLKDAPFGVAGFAEYGAVRVRANPQIRSMLQRYVNTRETVGV